jgi:hypothetical protein
MRSEFGPVIRGVKLLVAERARLSKSGPQFLIIHQFRKPETVCTPGEVIADILFLHRTKRISLPLSLRLMLVFDYLGRCRHLGQNAGQIAAGLSIDPFTRRHGAYAGARLTLSRKVSRRAVKQQIIRLRAALRQAFQKAGLSFDPRRVLISEESATNEVRYRLKASVNWEHLEN